MRVARTGAAGEGAELPLQRPLLKRGGRSKAEECARGCGAEDGERAESAERAETAESEQNDRAVEAGSARRCADALAPGCRHNVPAVHRQPTVFSAFPASPARA